MSTDRFTLYGYTGSGNCEKVRRTADRLGAAYDWVEVDIFAGESRTQEFLRNVNPAGQVPAMVLADGGQLAQSNAMMTYLAEGSDLIPADRLTRARMFAWMFWEQYSHEPYIAVRRALIRYMEVSENNLDPRLLERGEAALAHLDAALAERDWLAGEALSLADIALYPYTRDAGEGGFDLAPHANVQVWIKRVGQALAV